MSDWQKILRDESISTLEELKSYVAERFGADAAEREIDVEALSPAFDNFQMRISPNVMSVLGEPGSPVWNQYVPTTQELDVVDGVIDSLMHDLVPLTHLKTPRKSSVLLPYSRLARITRSSPNA